jgi:Flp pilus assembly protein TadD
MLTTNGINLYNTVEQNGRGNNSFNGCVMLKHNARHYNGDLRLKISFMLWLSIGYALRHGIFVAASDKATSQGLTLPIWFDLQSNIYLVLCDLPALLVLISAIFRFPGGSKWIRGIWQIGRWLLVIAYLSGIGGFTYLHFDTLSNPIHPDFMISVAGLLPDIVIAGYLLSSTLIRDIFAEFPENDSALVAASQLNANNSIRLQKQELSHARRLKLLQEPIFENIAQVNLDEKFKPHVVMSVAAKLEALAELGPAEALYRALLMKTLDFAPAWHSLGLLAFHTGKIDLAVLMLGSAIELDATTGLYARNLGEIYRRMGRLNEAVSLAHVACHLSPQDADARFNHGLALTDAKRIPEAVASYQETLKLNPQHASCWNNLGVLLQSTGDREGAIHAYNQAVTFNPDNIEAKKNLQNLLAT